MHVSASVSDAHLDTDFQEEARVDADEEEGETEQSEPELEEDTPEPDDAEALTYSEQNGADDVEDELELPPPMKPITEPILVATANGSSTSVIAPEGCGKTRVSSVFIRPHPCPLFPTNLQSFSSAPYSIYNPALLRFARSI